MKNNKKVKLLAIAIIATTALVLNANTSKAVTLQSNPNTQYTQVYGPNGSNGWITYFRQMENTGGAMGLNETLKSDLSYDGESNNIDVHMVRTTEYGAVAILSASGYGNPSNSNAITTTTGNNTGVILNTNYWERTAGGLEGYIFSGTNSRYYDTYTGAQTSARIGDALGNASTANPGCAGWHSASSSGWVYGSGPCFLRGYGGIFSFDYTDASWSTYCRGVAVVGSGF